MQNLNVDKENKGESNSSKQNVGKTKGLQTMISVRSQNGSQLDSFTPDKN